MNRCDHSSASTTPSIDSSKTTSIDSRRKRSANHKISRLRARIANLRSLSGPACGALVLIAGYPLLTFFCGPPEPYRTITAYVTLPPTLLAFALYAWFAYRDERPKKTPSVVLSWPTTTDHLPEENPMKYLLVSLLTLSALAASAPLHAGTMSGNVRIANPSGNSASPAGDHEPVVLWLQQADTANPSPTPPPLTISQRKLQFTPDFLVVPQGQTIHFPNDDDVAHNVYVIAGPNQFNFGLYPKGQERSMVFNQPGLVDMYCSVHPQMHARIFVVPSPYFATTFPGRSFSIANVPPGRYTLKVWHERSRIFSRTVTVPASGALNETIILENISATSTTAKEQ